MFVGLGAGGYRSDLLRLSASDFSPTHKNMEFVEGGCGKTEDVS